MELDPQILWEMLAIGCFGVERVKMTLDVELHQQLAGFSSLVGVGRIAGI